MTGTSSDGSGSSHHELSGSADDVIQARDVTGGIHFHGLRERTSGSPVPRQLPADVRDFVNRVDDLTRLDVILSGRENDPRSATACAIVGTAGVGKPEPGL